MRWLARSFALSTRMAWRRTPSSSSRATTVQKWSATSGQDNSKAAGEPEWFRKERGYSDHKQPYEFYNLREDLTQTTNRYAEEMARAKAMLAVLEQFQTEGRSVPQRTMDKK